MCLKKNRIKRKPQWEQRKILNIEMNSNNSLSWQCLVSTALPPYRTSNLPVPLPFHAPSLTCLPGNLLFLHSQHK